MTKLTITSVCTKGPVYPMIFNFLNGYQSEYFECKCAIIQDNNGKKTIAAEIDQLLYVGVEENENIGQTLLLVRNRKTGKVRLIETECVELKPIINDNDSNLQFTQTSNLKVHHLQQETANLEPNMSPKNYHQQSETNEFDAVMFLNQHEQLVTSGIETDTIPIHGMNEVQPSRMSNHELQNAVVFDARRSSKQYEISEFESNMLNHDHQGKASVIDSRIPKHPDHTETREIESSRMLLNCHQKPDTSMLSSLRRPKHSQQNSGTTESNTVLNHCIQLHLSILPNQQPETEHKGSPRHKQVKETNETKLNVIVNNCEQLKTNKEANMIRSIELLRDMFEEKETEMENVGKVAEKTHFTIDSDTEDLKILEPNCYCEESVLSGDNNNEIEENNHLKSKLTQEENEKQWQSKNKEYSIKQLFVEALGLDSNGERKAKQNEVSCTSNDDITNNKADSSKRTVEENAYICDYCEYLFENKGSIIFHLISHKFVEDTYNDVAKSKIKGINNGDMTNNDSVSSKQNVEEKAYICDH